MVAVVGGIGLMTCTRHPLQPHLYSALQTAETWIGFFPLLAGWRMEGGALIALGSQQLCPWLRRCRSGWLRAAWDPTLCMSVAGPWPALLDTSSSEDQHWALALPVVTWLEDWEPGALRWCRSRLEHERSPLGATLWILLMESRRPLVFWPSEVAVDLGRLHGNATLLATSHHRWLRIQALPGDQAHPDVKTLINQKSTQSADLHQEMIKKILKINPNTLSSLLR